MPEKYYMTWDEVLEGLEIIDERKHNVYGVPRGGMIAAGFLKYANRVTTPEQADIILDDIIDSGATRDRFKRLYPDKDFVALVDKTGAQKDLGWVVFPWEKEDVVSASDIVIRQLQYIGEDVTREGLLDTPSRVIRSWQELYSGYHKDVADVFKVFKDGACDEMVLLKNIEFYSTCEHHMLPFFGKAHIAYVPDGKVVGISKLARLLEVFARRLQIQERLGQQITEALIDNLKPKGAACILEAQHFCMTSRGVQKQDSIMVTSSLTGVFREIPEARSELLMLINR